MTDLVVTTSGALLALWKHVLALSGHAALPCLAQCAIDFERTFECALSFFFSMACKVLGPSTGGCWRSRTNCNNSSCFGRIVPRRTVVVSSSHDQPATSQRSMDTLDLLLGSTDPSPGLTHKSSVGHISGLRQVLTAYPFRPSN